MFTTFIYNIGWYGTISINRWGLLACWNDFFLPGLPEIHEQGGVHLVTDDMLQKLGIVIGGARTSGRSWFLFPYEIGCKKLKVLGGPFKGEVVRVVIWGTFFLKKNDPS